MFDKSEIEQEPEPKKKRRKGSPRKWVPSDEFMEMVRVTLIEEGFPISRTRFSRRKKRVSLRIRCRGYDEIHFVFRRFYTPHHVRQFLKIWLRWDDPKWRPKNGRPKSPPKPPKIKDWSMDRRTKAWRSKVFYEPNPLRRGKKHPHGSRRSGKPLAPG